MRVIATAGHVDHGKSTLIRALTGMEPDRWAEERRRGLTIDLGFAWTELGDHTVAFVDVPGHQRFVSNMLAGVGPVPAVLFVVAADDGWNRQSGEHLDAIRAFGIGSAVLVVTKADLVEPERAAEVGRGAQARLVEAGLTCPEFVTVSASTDRGLAQLRATLVRVLDGLPEPVLDAPVRFWIDRAFTVRGAGAVVTGTLGAGRIAVGERFDLISARHSRPVTVRAVQQLEQPTPRAEAVARVAVNLRSVAAADLARGDCLLSPGQWPLTTELDVRLDPVFFELTEQQQLHLGSATIAVRVRLLADGIARLRLERAVPVRVGDRAVLRDPGRPAVSAGVIVLDPEPPPLHRRGAAAARGRALRSGSASTTTAQVARRGAVRADHLQLLGFPVPDGPDGHGWLVAEDTWAAWLAGLEREVDAQTQADPRRPWLSEDEARQRLQIPAPELLADLAAAAGLGTEHGRLARAGARPGFGAGGAAIAAVLARLVDNPFAAPERTELQQAGVTARDLATAARTGLVLRLGPDLVVGPDAVERAVELLADLEQPFTLSQARQRLGTTRRVAIPLLERLDRLGRTSRDRDDRRRLLP